MKKAIAFLLVLVTVIGLFSACAIKPGSVVDPYTSYISYNGTTSAHRLKWEIQGGPTLYAPEELMYYYAGAELNEDGGYTLRNKSFFITKTAFWGDETFNGKLNTSDPYKPGYLYYRMKFITEDGIKFQVKEDTDEIVILDKTEYYLQINDFSKQELEINPDDYQEIANEYALTFIDDMDKYYSYAKISSKNTIVYYYVRTFDGKESIDRLTITLTPDGEFCGFNSENLGCFKDKEISVNETKIKESVEEKLKKGFAENGFELVSYTFSDWVEEDIRYKVAVSADGLIGVNDMYDCIIKDSEGNEYSVYLAVFTTVEVTENGNTETNSDGNEEIDWREIE